MVNILYKSILIRFVLINRRKRPMTHTYKHSTVHGCPGYIMLSRAVLHMPFEHGVCKHTSWPTKN